MTAPRTHALDGLRSLVLRGLAWKAASQLLLQVSRFVVALVLARLLTPHDWGLAAMVLVFSGLVVLFADSALGTALIQRRVLSDTDRSTVFWTGVAVGAALTGAGIALSGPLAELYGEREVRPLFAALSLSFLVTSLGTTQAALLIRDMDFKSLEVRRMGAAVVGAVVGITVAAKGFGAWAIVTQQLAIAAVETVLVWRITEWRPSAVFSPASLRSFANFTGNVFGQNLLYYAGRNVDRLLIGRYLGAGALGIYALAYNVMLAPFTQIAGPLQQVLFPAFSRMRDDRRRMAAVWIRTTRLVGAISIPALTGLIIVAPDFVSTVLGERWAEATPIIRILAWVGLMQSLQTLNGEILLALGRAGTLLNFTVLWFAASLGAVVVGLQWGIVGVAVSYLVASLFVEPLNAVITARALGISVWMFVRGLAGVVEATALMSVAVLAARWLLVELGTPAAVRLVVLVALGVAVFVPACAWRSPEAAAEVTTILRRRRAEGAARVEPLTEPRFSER
jgi:O-antigen/teichoic acid export membrane protein